MNLPSVPATASAKDRLYGIVFISLAAFFWAALELSAHFIPSGYGASQTVWMRYATHLLFMLLAFGPHYRTKLVRTNHLKLQLFRPTLMIAMPLCFLFGIKFMSVENVWSVFWIAPLMSMLMALFLLGEHITVSCWVCAIIGLLGVLCILGPDKNLLSWRLIFPFGMAFCYSLYVIFTRLLRTERTVTNLFFTAMVVLVPWSLGLPHFWRQLNLRAAMAMGAVGLLGLVSLFFLDRAYDHAPASILAPFTYTEAVFAVILSYFIFGHFPDQKMIVGSLIVISVGLFLVYFEICPSQVRRGYRRP